jgi:hypothetical protein
MLRRWLLKTLRGYAAARSRSGGTAANMIHVFGKAEIFRK